MTFVREIFGGNHPNNASVMIERIRDGAEEAYGCLGSIYCRVTQVGLLGAAYHSLFDTLPSMSADFIRIALTDPGNQSTDIRPKSGTYGHDETS